MNVLLEALPEEWNGYIINTDYRVGIRISLALEDPDLLRKNGGRSSSFFCFRAKTGA